jgi:hypothetical protein
MISTVTTSTVTTITTLSTTELAASLGLIAIVTLLVLVIQREVVTASPGPRAIAFSQALNVAIVPLLLGFLLIAVDKISAVLLH